MTVDVLADKIIHETDEAVLVEVEGDEEHWLPFSQIQRVHRYPDGSVKLEITDWLARKIGLL